MAAANEARIVLSRERVAPVLRQVTSRMLVICVFLCGSLISSRPALAQAPWEYSPYQIKLWLSLDESEFPPQLQAMVADFLAQRADAVHGAAWDIAVTTSPPEFQSLIDPHPQNPPTDALQIVPEEVLSADKLILVSVILENGAYKVRARELDCRTRQWSPIIKRSATHRGEVALIAWDAIGQAFTPLARIESVDGKSVTAQVRAAGLVTDPDSPLLVRIEDVLRPIIRRNNRSGQPTENGIQAPEWTLLRVTGADQSRVACELISGFRAPIPSKGGQRTDRLALRVRPAWPETRLVLMSRTRPSRPLGGYEVLRRGDGESQPQLLGTTASDGSFRLPATDGLLQPLLIRSGGQLLARLPLVPGQAPELTANVVDDDGRLRAEGFVLAFQSRVMDLVARRELLAAQFRQLLSGGKLEEAQQILEEYRLLESRGDMLRVLDQQQQEISSPDRLTQLRIERIFSDARQLLHKFLDPNTANDLARELAAARTRPPAASPASAKGAASPPLATPSQP